MKLATITPNLQAIREYYKSSVFVDEQAEKYGTASICSDITIMLDYIEQLQQKINHQAERIDRLVDTCRANDIGCGECGGELSRAELEEGYCLDCSRSLS